MQPSYVWRLAFFYILINTLLSAFLITNLVGYDAVSHCDFLKYFLLLFKYSCLYFPATTSYHPTHTYLSPSISLITNDVGHFHIFAHLKIVLSFILLNYMFFFWSFSKLNLLGWHWLIKLCTFQVHNSIIHHLYIVLSQQISKVALGSRGE